MIRSCETFNKGHGRYETRKISVVGTHSSKLDFAGVKQVAQLDRQRENVLTGKKQEEEIYLITNMDYSELTAEELLENNRGYWDIENKLHYRKDFVFKEDLSTIRKKHGPRNMSALRNFAISVMMGSGITNVKRCVDNIQYGSSSDFHTSLFRL